MCYTFADIGILLSKITQTSVQTPQLVSIIDWFLFLYNAQLNDSPNEEAQVYLHIACNQTEKDSQNDHSWVCKMGIFRQLYLLALGCHCQQDGKPLDSHPSIFSHQVRNSFVHNIGFCWQYLWNLIPSFSLSLVQKQHCF